MEAPFRSSEYQYLHVSATQGQQQHTHLCQPHTGPQKKKQPTRWLSRRELRFDTICFAPNKKNEETPCRRFQQTSFGLGEFKFARTISPTSQPLPLWVEDSIRGGSKIRKKNLTTFGGGGGGGCGCEKADAVLEIL